MSPVQEDKTSIRVRLDEDLLERIDKVAGSRGRQHWIREAILWRLDQEIPPMVLDLSEEVAELRARVEHLETAQETDLYHSKMNETLEREICRDDLERDIMAYILREGGATTPELSEALLGTESKRRTILDRIDKLNENAMRVIGVPILAYERGIVQGKRGAWWLINEEYITE
jgi:hypothetical protein